MPLTAIVLVLLAALLHAVWNIVAKKSGGGTHFVTLGALMVVLLWAPLGLVMMLRQAPAWVSVIIEFDGVMIEVDDGWLERFNGSAALEAS